MVVLKWAWHRFLMDVEEFDSLKSAVDAAYWAQEAGTESLEAVEVVSPDQHRRVLSAGEVIALAEEWHPVEEPTGPPPTFYVEALAPSGEWGRVGWFHTESEANAEAQRWRQMLRRDARVGSWRSTQRTGA